MIGLIDCRWAEGRAAAAVQLHAVTQQEWDPVHDQQWVHRGGGENCLTRALAQRSAPHWAQIEHLEIFSETGTRLVSLDSLGVLETIEHGGEVMSPALSRRQVRIVMHTIGRLERQA